MRCVEYALADDKSSLVVIEGLSRSARLTASDVDELVRQLVELRAQMTPVHTAEPQRDRNQLYLGDNLLWCVRSAAQGAILELGVQHPGMGWILLPLAREQVEDLQNQIEFTLRGAERPL